MVRPIRVRRGFYMLPTLFTIGNLLCGFIAVVDAFQGQFARAALLVIAAGVLDLLDGRIARLTRTTSEFGSEFDSLADMVSFGIAPSMLAYAWVLRPFGRLGLFVAFLFVVCAAMRLARYNLQSQSGERRHFVGLSSPVAAGSLATAIFALPESVRLDRVGAFLLLLLVATLALLMISRFRYRSFKDLTLTSRRSYVYVLPLAATLIAVVIWPRWSLPTLATAYLLSAPIVSLSQILRRGRASSRSSAEVLDEPAARR